MANLVTKACWNAFTLWHARTERKLPYRPLADVLALQSRRVQAMAAHAYRNVPFYRDAMEQGGLKPGDFQTAADLAKLPLIDAHVFCDQPERFLAKNFMHRSGLVLNSSGTSGRAKQIRYDARALFLSLANGHRQRIVFSKFSGKLLGYREMSLTRLAGVSLQMRRFYESHSWTPSVMDLTRGKLPAGDLSIQDTVAGINEFRPDVLTGYGSYLGALFREVHRRKLEVYRPSLITYGADKMNDADRLLIEQEFGIPVTSTYQCVEALRIGFFCEERRGFHLSLDAVSVRLVDDRGRDAEPGAAGHVVLSNLTNRATVLLNYRLGDVATLSQAPCPCGRTLPVIEALYGRSDDLLRLPDGRPMHALTVLEKLQAVPGVLQVQIVQHTPRHFTLRVVGKSGVQEAEAAAALIHALRSKAGDEAHVGVQWMDTITPGANGKVKAVVSQLEQTET
jgi:phenylacetate-coenzyme A ligase PaaK-like adenylate-forming protein